MTFVRSPRVGVRALVEGAHRRVSKHPLQTAAIVGAGIATVLTDGAASGLLIDATAAATEDTTVTIIDISVVDIPSETTTAGKIIGYLGQGASAVQAFKDCTASFNATCWTELATLAVGVSGPYVGLSDMQNAWLNYVLSFVPLFDSDAGSATGSAAGLSAFEKALAGAGAIRFPSGNLLGTCPVD